MFICFYKIEEFFDFYSTHSGFEYIQLQMLVLTIFRWPFKSAVKVLNKYCNSFNGCHFLFVIHFLTKIIDLCEYRKCILKMKVICTSNRFVVLRTIIAVYQLNRVRKNGKIDGSDETIVFKLTQCLRFFRNLH